MTETKCDESVSGEMNGRAGGWMEVGRQWEVACREMCKV